MHPELETKIHHSRSMAFTLVEMLVVMGIIGLLVTLTFVGVASVRQSARIVETRAQFNALDAGLETYRNTLQETYPPSTTITHFTPTAVMARAGRYAWYHNGANLLVLALAGQDFLGTAGFKDLDQDGDMEPEMDDLYEMSPQGQPLFPRSGTFVDGSKSRITNCRDFFRDTIRKRQNQPLLVNSAGNIFFADGFGYPILYYKANPGAKYLTTDPIHHQGVYDQSDNAFFTGKGEFVQGSGIMFSDGLDMGGGSKHYLNPLIHPGNSGSAGPSSQYTLPQAKDHRGTFDHFILNKKITVREEPANQDTYLLISPGPDAIWGTTDDVTNFDHNGVTRGYIDLNSAPSMD